MPTLGFLDLGDFVLELKKRKVADCRLQPLVDVEAEPGLARYFHRWIVAATARAEDEVLACSVLVHEDYVGTPVAPVDDDYDADLVRAHDAVCLALAEAGVSTRPGVYTHQAIGYACAPDLWHYGPDGLLILGPPDRSEQAE